MVLIEQEIKSVLNDIVVELGGDVAQRKHTDDGEFNMYSASF